MKLTPRRVLALWRHNPGWQASFSTVRGALGAKKAQTEALQGLLGELVGAGRLTYDKRRYRLGPAGGPSRPRPSARSRKTGQKSARGMEGRFSAHANGYGFVTVEGAGEALFIPPRKIGGALDGDLVRIALSRSRRDQRVVGEVTAVLERHRTSLRGFVHQEHGETWVLPLNPKLPMVFVAPEDDAVAHGPEDVVEAEIVTHPADADTAPTGRILLVIENADAPAQVLAAIMDDLQIEAAFSPETEQAMARLAKRRPDFAVGKREDLTGLPFVTIDGEDARDFDDAVYATPLPGGGWRLLVAIADVAHFVAQGSALDGDAYARGTSVYFPQNVVPMLPELLSNDLCSLRPGERRFTLTCEMELDERGARNGYRIFESVIESKARLTYTQVTAYLDEGRKDALGKAAPHAEMIAGMGELARVLREKRSERGALDFEFPEPRFAFEKGERPVRVEKALPTTATRLIEQLMVEANETVAWHCAEHDIPILYRVHDPPPQDQLAELRKQVQIFGLDAPEKDLRDPLGLNRLLARIRSHPLREELELMVLRAMTQACYRASNDGHFALTASHYAHFTSPIRRYPDLIAHRALKHALTPGRRGSRKKADPPFVSADAGVHLSSRERTAGAAGGRAVKLYRVLYMEPFLGESFDAVVTGLSARGLWVALRDHFVEGFLPLALLPEDHYRYDAGRNALRGRRMRREVRFGQKLTVQLARAERMTQELEFAFNAWEWVEQEQQRPRKRCG